MKTAQQLINSIPQHWKKEPIFISDSMGNLEPVRSVKLEKDFHGRRIVIISHHLPRIPKP